MKTPITKDNPWGLSPGEFRAMQTLLEAGHAKGVARELDLSTARVSVVLRLAQRKLGARSRLGAALAFDRWLRTYKDSTDDLGNEGANI